MANTKISWTDKSWNPISGCSKVSDGCKNCYAEVMAKRLQAMGIKGYENGFEVTLHPERLSEPYKWKKPQKIFVCSMSDLFHEGVPDCFILQILFSISHNKKHIFQILTKRIERVREWRNHISFNPNVWLGVTVESDKYLHRIKILKTIPAKTKFISFEPLLSPIPELDLSGIDWVIVGSESGYNARPMNIEWVRDIKKQCDKRGIAFFMKQICKNGRDIGYEHYPMDLKVRNFPNKK